MTLPKNTRRGLTLIELIASLTVFLLVMATLVMAVNTSLDTWRRSRDRARQIITGRAALDLIVADLQHAIADPTNFFYLKIVPNDIHQTQSNLTNWNCVSFHRMAPNPAADGLAAMGDVLWHVQPTNSLGALVREFIFPSANGGASNRVVLAEGVATLQFIPLGILASNTPPADLMTVSNLPPVIDVYLELLSPADGRRAQGMAQPERDVYIARRAVRVATRVAFSACQLPPQDKPATYTCSGRITDAAGKDLNGVEVYFVGPSTNAAYPTATTTANGTYSNNVPSWWPAFTILPQLPTAGGTGVYDPQQRVCRLSQGDLSGQDFCWTPSDLVISGRVIRASSGTAVPGARITFPNAGEAETDANGNYAIGINYGWPYGGTVDATPSHPHGGTFVPASIGYADLQQNMADQNYVWTPPMLVISGFVAWADSGNGIADATITFGGAAPPAPVTTAIDGFYRQAVPYEWSGLLTPALPAATAASGGYFEPANADFVNLLQDVRQDFIWTQWPVAVSGRVYYANSYTQGLPGVTIRFDNGGPTVLSGTDGTYVGYVPTQWSGTATPSYPADGIFIPSQRSYNLLTASVADQNYQWAAFEFLIAGRVLEAGTGLAVTNAAIRFLTLQGYAAATNVIVHADGTYTNRVSAGWSGVTMPSWPTNGTFAPVTNAYQNVTADHLGQDFLWTP